MKKAFVAADTAGVDGRKKAALHNLGCKVNAYETQAMQQMLLEAGYEIVPFTESADVYVINTCSVTGIADRKSRQMLHRARKRNPHAVIVGVGCYVQTKEEEILADGVADIIIGNNRKHLLPSLLAEYEKSGRKVKDVPDAIGDGREEYEELYLARTAEHTRAFLKVQDGCNQFCSYCIIPYARGRVRSRREEDVIAETARLAENGYREVVLTGIHLSSYGVDSGGNLLRLIEQVHAVEGIRRIRLGSLEPRIVTEEFVRRLSGLPKVCPHFHLSLQSGCDTVLKRMNRHYSTAEYERGCALLRRYFSCPAITTDVIAGFPGETEAEFEETMAYLSQIRFYEMHIFKYSKREGTRAAAEKNQVPEPVKAARSARLLALAEEMSKEYRDAWIGKETEVLLEEGFSFQGEEYFMGFTAEYVKAAVKRKTVDGNPENRFVRGRLEKQLTDDVYLLVEF